MICLIIWISGIFLAILTLVDHLPSVGIKSCIVIMNYELVIPWILVSVRFVCILIQCFTYVRIYIQTRKISRVYFKGSCSHEMKVFWKVLCITIPHLTVHLLYVGTFIVTIENVTAYESTLFVFAICIDMWVYVLRFEECRVNLMMKLFACCKARKHSYLQRRQNMYAAYLSPAVPFDIPSTNHM